MKPQKEGPAKYFTVTPSVIVFRCMDHPVALLVLHYVLIRKRIYPQFRIADMAQQLNKDKRTIRTAVKRLRKLELLVLKGNIGSQYYEFNEAKYQAYLLINPFASGDAPSQKKGVVPSQEMRGDGIPRIEGRPLPKNEGVKSKGIEERESKETDVECRSQPPLPVAVAQKNMTGEEMAEAFDRCFHSDGYQGSDSNSVPEDKLKKDQDNGSQPPVLSVAPVTHQGSEQCPAQALIEAASGGVDVGLASESVPAHSDSNIIQPARGKSNAGGLNNNQDKHVVSVPAPMIQGSASGERNVGALNSATDHSGRSATRAAGTMAVGFTDEEKQELSRKTGMTMDQIKRYEGDYLLEEVYGFKRHKPKKGFDS